MTSFSHESTHDLKMVGLREQIEHLDAVDAVPRIDQPAHVAGAGDGIAAHQHDDRRASGRQSGNTAPAKPVPGGIGDDQIDATGGLPCADI